MENITYFELPLQIWFKFHKICLDLAIFTGFVWKCIISECPRCALLRYWVYIYDNMQYGDVKLS